MKKRNRKKQDRLAELEKEQILNPERLAEKKKKGIQRRCLLAAAMFFLLIAVCGGSYMIVRAVGKANLKRKAETQIPRLDLSDRTEEVPEEEKEIWQEGWVRYKGKIYAYNEDIMTFLFMGIDKETDVMELEEGTNGGQADALFLAVMNPHTKSVEVIGVNRNTMTDIDVYDEGAYVTTMEAQIAVQHGFGNGVEESCEYQKKAVRNLFYDIPVHGYAAINMSAIPTVNDAVGGVEVTVKEDLTKADPALKEGAQVQLLGKSALLYVRYRDVDAFASADSRLSRQKQYLEAFIGAAKKAVKEDVSAAADIYQAVVPMMVTDVTIDEAVYLASIFKEYHFDAECFHMVEGETVQGEKFEEFYVDEDALYELVIDIFYEEVDIDG